MPDGSGTSSRLVFKLIHPGIVNRFSNHHHHRHHRRYLVPRLQQTNLFIAINEFHEFSSLMFFVFNIGFE